MIAAGGEERDLVCLLPALDLVGLALEAEQHERWRAFGMDEVAAGVGELLDHRLIGRDRALELVGGALVDVEEQREHADAFRQHADQLFQPARTQGRLDAAQQRRANL